MPYQPRHARRPTHDELAAVSSALAGLADLITIVPSSEQEK